MLNVSVLFVKWFEFGGVFSVILIGLLDVGGFGFGLIVLLICVVVGFVVWYFWCCCVVLC